MDTLATSVSLALQYGVPLKDVVNKFAHVRFEPSGFTGNPEIPIAKSLVDYIFRWLGSRFLAPEDKATLGLIDRSQVVADAPAPFGASALRPRADEGLTAQSEAIQAPVAAPAPAPATDDAAKGSATPAAAASPATVSIPVPVVKEELAVIATNSAASAGNGSKRSLDSVAASLGGSLGGGAKVAFSAQADAPSCAECGSIMVRNGSCYKCLNCGSTSGCS